MPLAAVEKTIHVFETAFHCTKWLRLVCIVLFPMFLLCVRLLLLLLLLLFLFLLGFLVLLLVLLLQLAKNVMHQRLPQARV